MKNINKENSKRTISEMIKDTFLNSIDDCINNGEVPVWKGGFWKANFFNFASETVYHKYNTFLLYTMLRLKSPIVSTYKGWDDLNKDKSGKARKDKNKLIHIKKGSKASFVIYYNWIFTNIAKDDNELYKDIEDAVKKLNAGKVEYSELDEIMKPYIKATPFLKTFNVWSADDIENLSDEWLEEQATKFNDYNKLNIDDNVQAMDIVNAYCDYFKIPIIEKYETVHPFACITDERCQCIKIPRLNQYNSTATYYGDLFHELIHATAPDLGRSIGKTQRAKEELIAEFGASALLEICGLEDKELSKNSLAYILSWGKQLDNSLIDDKQCVENVKALFNQLSGNAIVSAIASAEKAVKRILEVYNIQNLANTNTIRAN